MGKIKADASRVPHILEYDAAFPEEILALVEVAEAAQEFAAAYLDDYAAIPNEVVARLDSALSRFGAT